ncbi:UL15 [anatid alphaherpesvirus 1]|uniref:UL15 n=3 Tax=anatid alphaherpesvirus 1 TaxID=104388 RepID=C6ZD26_9ALPH|nr:UL15 [Anatid alphaherpesvirus 1]AHD45965.1 UL15 [BAC cloning vector pDEV-vac]QWQ49810.1 UL15 [BAC cloning vector pDEV-CHa]ABY73916.2 UL15 protein [Anatid alphaherpesvirus 1]ACT83557.1 UL15 [Anatid alphaherpesvirus 1]AGA17839.1 UL15 [Anatid alphaherpesvirus 1]
MFGATFGRESRKYFEELRRKYEERNGSGDTSSSTANLDDSDIAVPFLNFATCVPRRHQTVIPAIGTLHDCCEHAPIFSGVARYLRFSSLLSDSSSESGETASFKRPVREAFLVPDMIKTFESLRFAEYGEEETIAHKNAYYSVLNAFKAMRDSDEFGQLNGFINSFARLLDTSFQDAGTDANTIKAKRSKVDVPTYGKMRGTLELFQKMILMHATYFLASVILGDHADKADNFLRIVFDIPLFSETSLRHFRQRATVFLVPRRHGKTWFIVPLIALALTKFRGIKIGYTAHIRKATEPVFDEIDARIRRWFGNGRVEHIKGETISFSFQDGSKSTVTFASSHNTNSLRGQDFNLLFVDEANFIRSDAVQTIVGFLNQTNCKIIFVSSTNTGKSSTSFLYNLKGATDELLNVVTYICDDHMRRVANHTNATSCSCYVLNKPVFITMDGAMRRTAEMFMADSFMQEIIGGGEIAGNEKSTNAQVFTYSSLDRFLIYRPSTVANMEIMSQDLFVYVDPAFSANTRASGTGIAVIGRYKTDFVIYGLEHFFLRALTGDSATAIGLCTAICIAQICALHKRRFGTIRIAVEGNSNQDSAVAIAKCICKELTSFAKSGTAPAPKSVLFYHCVPPNGDVAYPFFLLNKQKTDAFDLFIRKFNSGDVLASQELVSTTISLRTDPVEYLTRQMKNLSENISGASEQRTFTAKTGGCADDTLVALVMALYLAACFPNNETCFAHVGYVP